MAARNFVLRSPDAIRSMWAFLQANWQAAADGGRPLSVDVSEHKSKRNGQQNALMWARLRQVSAEAWVGNKQFSPEAWHAYFAGKFIGYEEGVDGAQVPISTTTLDTGSFAEYITQIEAYAATELGVELL